MCTPGTRRRLPNGIGNTATGAGVKRDASSNGSGELPFNGCNEPIYEYACHEGNYALPAILAGAREEERTQQEQAKQ